MKTEESDTSYSRITPWHAKSLVSWQSSTRVLSSIRVSIFLDWQEICKASSLPNMMQSVLRLILSKMKLSGEMYCTLAKFNLWSFEFKNDLLMLSERLLAILSSISSMLDNYSSGIWILKICSLSTQTYILLNLFEISICHTFPGMFNLYMSTHSLRHIRATVLSSEPEASMKSSPLLMYCMSLIHPEWTGNEWNLYYLSKRSVSKICTVPLSAPQARYVSYASGDTFIDLAPASSMNS